MIHKIGILTSGGDAPGMNAAVRAVVRAGIHHGLEVYGVIDGYRGLVESNFVKLSCEDVDGILNRGGTFLGTARLPEFKELATRELAVANLKKSGIEALVVIGGDGSYMGALRLTEMGINCIGLPGTIDNDIASTDCTIGYDTCLNTICEAVDRIRDTMTSHKRCAVIEIMGNHCADLTLYGALATGAEVAISPACIPSNEDIIAILKKAETKKRKNAIVLITENMEVKAADVAKMIAANTSFETKVTVLGHIQRGGTPSAVDRMIPTEMGIYAVNLLLQGKGGRAVGVLNGKIVDNDIIEALAMPRQDRSAIVAELAELA